MFNIMDIRIPYFESNPCRIKKLEVINDSDFTRYINLLERKDSLSPDRPDLMNFFFIDSGDRHIYQKACDEQRIIKNRQKFLTEEVMPHVKVSKIDVSTLGNLSEETRLFLKKHSNFNHFVESIKNLVLSSTYGKFEI